MIKIRSKGWANQFISHILWSFTHSQSLWHFWRRKSTFWMEKIPENFRRHIFKVQNRELNLSIKEPKSVWKKLVSYIHLKINVLFIIQGHILFIFSSEMLYFSCTKYNTSFKLSDLILLGSMEASIEHINSANVNTASDGRTKSWWSTCGRNCNYNIVTLYISGFYFSWYDMHYLRPDNI